MLTYMSSWYNHLIIWYNHLIIMITNNYDNYMGCYNKARPAYSILYGVSVV